MIVPFERLGELLEIYETEFNRRALDVAIWGHISDGNLHPNVLPRSFADVEAGRLAVLDLGREVIRLAGRHWRNTASAATASSSSYSRSCTVRPASTRCGRSSARWIRSGSSLREFSFPASEHEA